MHHAGVVPALLFHLIAVDAVQPDAGRVRAIGVTVGERSRIALRVPLLAGGGAGLATHAGVEVNDETQFFLVGLRSWERGHLRLRSFARTGNCGWLSADWSAALSTRTLRSYQAACPVTGSLLEKR